jgi:eukaryotic-like serine/threonine-protein kinase
MHAYMRFSAGGQLGHFEIVATLGAGGMGEVYRARDLRLGREVAIKVIPEALVRDERARHRLEQEARAVAALSHPNIMVVYELDHDASSDVTFLAAELLEGETLRSRIARSAIAWRKAAEISASLADGLAAAHAKNITHRDLKPENIFITSDGRVKILDFGLAQTAVMDVDPAAATIQHTSSGGIAGTIGYMAPEQARGEPVDTRSDLFALGCVLFEMLTAEPAFRGSSGADTLVAILTREVSFSDEVRRRVPAELIRIAERCLAKNREERFQSARDLAFDLRSIATGSDSSRSGQSPAVFDSIAVLPFQNSSGDPDAEYLSDGLTESIINRLSGVPRLRVMARSTVFRFKGKESDPLEAGRALNVRAVLTGGVMLRQGRLMIRTEMADVSTGAHLWGERYQRSSADLLEVEEEIAREISERLRVRLTGETQERIARCEPVNTEAYHAFLKGRYWWFKRTEPALYRGLDHFRDALEADPGYALAWVGVADSYNILGFYSLLPPGDAFPKAESATQKALGIDPLLAEAHTSLAYALHNYRWDWQRAGDSYRRGIELRPDYPIGHQFYGIHLFCMGKFDDAIKKFEISLDLDPLALIGNAALGWAHYNHRDYERAADQLLKTLAIEDTFGLAHLWLAWTYREMGRLDDALAQAESPEALASARVEAETAQAIVHADAGRHDEARRILDSLRGMARDRFVQPYELATIHAALGDKDTALAALEDAFSIRSHRLTYMNIDPKLDTLRGDPHFDEIVSRMAFPQTSYAR